jgi:ethanolamine ammonia-lyase small subunit
MGAELDPFARLRPLTRARIGLARAGDAMGTPDLLAFQLACAQARDAVHTPLDLDTLAAALPLPPVRVRSLAGDRATYLRRPDLGRQLDPADRARLAPGDFDLALVLGDGLSSVAVQRHGPPLVAAILALVSHLNLAPVVVAEQARVAIGDDIGEALGARLTAVILGERPGLSSADSLGVYLTYAPRPGRKDAERNCISNIHAHGLSYADAARKLVWLVDQALSRGLTGIGLKDDDHHALIPATPSPQLDREAP